MQRGHSTDEPPNSSAVASAVDHPHPQQQSPASHSSDAPYVCENITFSLNGWMATPTTVIVPRLFANLNKLREIAIAPFPSIGRELVVATAPGLARRNTERLMVAVADSQPDGQPSPAAEYDAVKLQCERQDLDWLLAASLWARVDRPTVQHCLHAPDELRNGAYFLLPPAQRTLRQLLDPLRPLPDLDVMCVTRCVADAVASLWRLGIHVGYELLTPDNIILVQDGPRAGHWQLANQLPALRAVEVRAAGNIRVEPGLLSPSQATFASTSLMKKAGGEPTACSAGWCTLLAVLRLAMALSLESYDASDGNRRRCPDDRAVQSGCNHWMLLSDLFEQLWRLQKSVDNLCRRSQSPPPPAILTLLEHCDIKEWREAAEKCERMPLEDLRNLHDTARRLEEEFESPAVGYVRLFSTGVF